MSLAKWYFDSKTGICKEFFFGGCDGNENNFKTETECNRKCKKTETGNDYLKLFFREPKC
jgi:hypothetical protein